MQEAENLVFADLPDGISAEKSGGRSRTSGNGKLQSGKHEVNYNTNHSHSPSAIAVARLFASLAQLLYEDPDRHKISKIDRKQRRQIDEKKRAQGMRIG